jgi:flagellar basal body-associated protein FliL
MNPAGDKLHEIDKLFKQSLEKFVPEQLGESWLLLQKKYKEKRARKLLLRIYAGLLIIGIVTSIYLFLKPQISEKLQTHSDIQHQTSARTKFPATSTEKPKTSFNSLPEQENETTRATINLKQNPDRVNKTIVDYTYPNSLQNQNIPENTHAKTLLSYSNKSILIDDKEEISYSIKIEVLDTTINSIYSDYGPVINADGSVLYFTSRRPVEIKAKNNKTKTIETENIYMAVKDSKTKKWKPAQLMPEPINQLGRFNSIIGLSNDGQRMLLYRDDKYGNGDIYEAILQGNVWSEPQKLPEPINSKYLETSASISPDGNTIYFVSNRPGGYGKLDIWYCTKKPDGTWDKAINAGSAINTAEDEEGAFIHPDGKTLYFSSRGHSSKGGYDVYKTALIHGIWQVPEPVEGLNDMGDDVYFVIDASGQKAFYSTLKQNKNTEKDIYEIKFVKKKEDNSPKLTLFKGEVYDKNSKEPLEAQLVITDLTTGSVISTFKSNASTGKFMISLPSGKNYALAVEKKGYLFYSENFNIPEHAGYKEINQTVYLDPLRQVQE